MTELESWVDAAARVHPMPHDVRARAVADKAFDDIGCSFRLETVLDQKATRKEGRKIHRVVAMARLQQMTKDRTKFDILALEPYQPLVAGASDPPQRYSAAQIWWDQWRAFVEANGEDQVIGTRIEDFPPISVAKAADLRALGIKSVEQLAALNDNKLGALGMQGEQLKRQAQAYLDASKGVALLSERDSYIQELEAKLALLTQGGVSAPPPPDEVAPEADPRVLATFEGWEDDAVRAYMADHGGKPDGRWSSERLRAEAAALAGRKKAAA